MRPCLYSLFLACSAWAAPILNTQVNCPVVSGMGALGCSSNAGAFFARVFVYPGANHFGSASASFRDDYVFTVTTGPAQGFFASCFEAAGDTYMGSILVGGSFAGGGIANTTRAFALHTCGQTSFTLGVPIVSTMLLSASVSTQGAIPQANAEVSFIGFQFFDAAGNPVTGVNYSLVEVSSVPEAATAWLLVCGLAGVGLTRRRV